ncbi:hypothetical protein ROTO_28410 [Roseovarius tolerans]|uniref:Uncharacterized protein n=1 Tax=Roseovarius tolerans TaxID=74031 RepID=A0A0L6CSG2_9RHOB|nr:hypothetical protein [Roseovarius tolerans]KNX40600.1 hypothetical protein ROTO_28410 [Roseovarius tolerans]
MQTKLHINLTQGIIDVEGDVELVKAVYEDFKDRMVGHAAPPPPPAESPATPAADAGNGAAPKSKRPARKRKKAKLNDNEESIINPDAPKLDKSLDTSKLGAYFGEYKVGNHPERVLIFLKFLIEELGIENPNTDQVYTCYQAVNERIPKVFSQAFRDASGRKFGYIDYNSPTDVPITTVGDNYFKFDLKRKGAE